ncbi:MAG: hypothetical protein SGJ05_03405 [bacterium]|nr:hypothetical protein [bacterium]
MLRRPTPSRDGLLPLMMQGGFYAYTATLKQWFLLDKASRSWSVVSIPGDLGRLVFLKNGAGVATSESFSIRTGIRMRASDESPWIEVAAPRRSDGKQIVFGIQSGNIGPIVYVNDTTVVIPLDSGVIIVANGRTSSAHSLPEGVFDATVALRERAYDVAGDSVLLTYSGKRLILFNVADLVSEMIVAPRSLGVGNVDLFRNTIVAYDHVLTGSIHTYASVNNSWTQGVRLFNADGLPTSVAPLAYVTAYEGSLWTSTMHGGIYEVASHTVPVLLPFLTPLNIETSALSRVLQIGTGAPTDSRFGQLFSGEHLVAYNDTATTLKIDTVSAASWESADRLYSGWRSLQLSTNAGSTWTNVEINGVIRDARSAIASIIHVGPNTMLLGSRGYVRRDVSGTVVDTIRGGIALSMDNGSVWTSLALPTMGQWVERIAVQPNGNLLAWVGDMYFDEETGTTSGGRFLHNDWTLLASEDTGKSWRTALTVPFFEQSATPTSWSIATSD